MLSRTTTRHMVGNSRRAHRGPGLSRSFPTSRRRLYLEGALYAERRMELLWTTTKGLAVSLSCEETQYRSCTPVANSSFRSFSCSSFVLCSAASATQPIQLSFRLLVHGTHSWCLDAYCHLQDHDIIIPPPLLKSLQRPQTSDVLLMLVWLYQSS